MPRWRVSCNVLPTIRTQTCIQGEQWRHQLILFNRLCQLTRVLGRCLRLKFREPGGNGGLGSSLKEFNMARPFRTRSTGMLSSNMSLREGSSPCLQCQSQMIATSQSFCFCRIDSGTMV